MESQLNIQNGAFHSIDYYENADDAGTSYGTSCTGSNRSRKNTQPWIKMIEVGVLQSFRFHCHSFAPPCNTTLYARADIGYGLILA